MDFVEESAHELERARGHVGRACENEQGDLAAGEPAAVLEGRVLCEAAEARVDALLQLVHQHALLQTLCLCYG